MITTITRIGEIEEARCRPRDHADTPFGKYLTVISLVCVKNDKENMKSITVVEQDQDQAVSPVIGIICMVAITVILAAVIGTFVLGFIDERIIPHQQTLFP